MKHVRFHARALSSKCLPVTVMDLDIMPDIVFRQKFLFNHQKSPKPSWQVGMCIHLLHKNERAKLTVSTGINSFATFPTPPTSAPGSSAGSPTAAAAAQDIEYTSSKQSMRGLSGLKQSPVESSSACTFRFWIGEWLKALPSYVKYSVITGTVVSRIRLGCCYDVTGVQSHTLHAVDDFN